MNAVMFGARSRWVRILSLSVLLVLGAGLPQAATAALETIEKRPGQTVDRLARSVLPQGAELMHKVVQVDIGIHSKAVVALYRAAPTTTNYSGRVLIPEANGNRFKVSSLPPLHEAEGLFDFEIVSVFSAALPSKQKGLAVLYKYLRLGSGEDAKNAGYFYLWNGSEWTIDEERTKRLVGIDTAAKARATIAAP